MQTRGLESVLQRFRVASRPSGRHQYHSAKQKGRMEILKVLALALRDLDVNRALSHKCGVARLLSLRSAVMVPAGRASRTTPEDPRRRRSCLDLDAGNGRGGILDQPSWWRRMGQRSRRRLAKWSRRRSWRKLGQQRPWGLDQSTWRWRLDQSTLISKPEIHSLAEEKRGPWDRPRRNSWRSILFGSEK